MPLARLPTQWDVHWDAEKGRCLGKWSSNHVMPISPSRIMNNFFLSSTIVQGCFHYLEPGKILLTLEESTKTFLRIGSNNTAFWPNTVFVLWSSDDKQGCWEAETGWTGQSSWLLCMCFSSTFESGMLFQNQKCLPRADQVSINTVILTVHVGHFPP